VRVWALLLVAQLEGDRTRAVEPLVALLADPLPDARADAAEALGIIGPPAAAALPALERLLSETSSHARENAKKAIAAIRGESNDQCQG
jgi:HEAT repeat protein